MNSFPISILFTVITLIFVLVLAWFLIKALSKFSNRGGEAYQGLKVNATLPLGARERLAVVTFKDKEYLLGITSSHIQVIDCTDNIRNNSKLVE